MPRGPSLIAPWRRGTLHTLGLHQSGCGIDKFIQYTFWHPKWVSSSLGVAFRPALLACLDQLRER